LRAGGVKAVRDATLQDLAILGDHFPIPAIATVLEDTGANRHI
jgi:hypothetical protein